MLPVECRTRGVALCVAAGAVPGRCRDELVLRWPPVGVTRPVLPVFVGVGVRGLLLLRPRLLLRAPGASFAPRDWRLRRDACRAGEGGAAPAPPMVVRRRREALVERPVDTDGAANRLPLPVRERSLAPDPSPDASVPWLRGGRFPSVLPSPSLRCRATRAGDVAAAAPVSTTCPSVTLLAASGSEPPAGSASAGAWVSLIPPARVV